MKRRRKPPKRLRRSGKSVPPGPGLPEKMVVVSLDPMSKPAVYGRAYPDDPEDVYRPVTVSEAEMARLMSDEENLCASAEDIAKFLQHVAAHDTCPENRRKAAAGLEDFLKPDGLFDSLRKMDEDPTARASSIIIDGEHYPVRRAVETSRSDLLRFFFRGSFERIEVVYLRALDDGVLDPVVLVLDPSDRRARALCEPHVGASEIDGRLAEAKRRGLVTLLVLGWPMATAVDDLAVNSPEVAHTIASPAPDGGYWAVVLAAGGAEAFPMPALP